MGKTIKRLNKFYSQHPVLANLGLLVAVAIALALLALVFMDVWTAHGSVTKVPEIRGMALDQAQQTLDDADLDWVIYDSIYDTKRAKGEVIEMSPRPNTTVKPGRTVYLTINAFSPRKVSLTRPIQGVSSRAARAYLESLGVTHVVIENVPSEYTDLVVRATANGHALNQGDTFPVDAVITLFVGHGVSTQADYYQEGTSYGNDQPTDDSQTDENVDEDLDFIDETGSTPPDDDEYSDI